MNKNEVTDKIKGALYGVAVGDALGAPLEFMSADQIKREHGRVTEMIGGGWLYVAKGEITDDTQMTLAVAEGIVANPNSPTEEIGARFVDWASSCPKDIGATCSASIRNAIAKAVDENGDANRPTCLQWEAASMMTAEQNGLRSGGNGALMRTVYPGLFYLNEQEAVQKASDIGKMTHWDNHSGNACTIYTRIIHKLIENAIMQQDNKNRMLDIQMALMGTEYDVESVLSKAKELEPTGYVVDSMMCAVCAFHMSESFEDAVANAANLGGDADTIAAITGGLAGAFYGFSAIPKRWTDALAPELRARLDALADAAFANRISK